MSNLRSVSSFAVPSVIGSSPVHEVLKRIQVRDPKHKSNGHYGRRLSDYESRAPGLQAMMAISVAAFLVGVGSWTISQKFVQIWTFPKLESSSPITPPLEPQLSIPEGIHRPAVIPPARQPTATPRNELAPQNLKAVFMGPRLVEFKWTPLGDEYQYRLYLAKDFSMQNAQPLSKVPTPTWSIVWTADDTDVRSVWAAVKGVDTLGRETAYSSPISVQLP